MQRDSDADFRAQLDAAREWEIALAKWIRHRGWYVLPTYDFSGKGDGKAPKLLAPPRQRDLVMPDLQCFRLEAQCDAHPQAQWLECKWKHEAPLYRKGGYLTTGISLRLFRHYERVQELTGQRVVLAFLHEKEQIVRGAPLDELALAWSHDYAGMLMGSTGMRFWRFDKIRPWCALAPIAALKPTHGALHARIS